MPAQNPLVRTPPFDVELALKKLGRDLRTARLRRNLSIEDVANRIGAGRRAVADAEKGKPSTAVSMYAGLLWVMGLLDQFAEAADPTRDAEGQRLAMSRDRLHSRPRKAMDDEF